MASTADSGSSVQPWRLLFDKGRSNRRNTFVESPRLLATADNLEYRIGDNGVWVAAPNLVVNDAPAGVTTNYGRALGVFSLDEGTEYALMQEHFYLGDLLWLASPLSNTPIAVDGSLNSPVTSGWSSSIPVDFVQFGNEVYVLQRMEPGSTQKVDLSDLDAPAIKRWGGPWYAFKGDGDTYGYTGTKLAMEAEWTWGHPHNNNTTVLDALAQVMTKRQSDTGYRWRWNAREEWMDEGPDADKGSIYQHNFGHLFPATGADSSDAMDYDIWLTEWDDVNKVESAFSADVSPIEYEPRHYGTPDSDYSPSYERTININTDETNTIHRVFQSRRTYPWTASSGDWSTNPDPMRRSTAGYAVGGGVLMLRINKDNIHPSTTHIRVYMSRRGGAYPEGSRVANRDLYVAAGDYTSYTGVETTLVCGKANTNNAAFLNLPDDLPGVPLDDLTGEFLTPSVGGVAFTNLAAMDTLQLWDANNEIHLYVARPTEEFQTLGGDLFPTVESTVNGEGFLLVPQDAPPPKCSFGAYFNNSIVTDDVDNPGLVRWSVADIPGSFPASYFYDMNDAFVAARKLGRYLMLFGKNKLVLSRYLPYDDVSAESISGAFMEIDSTRGASYRDLTCSFTHPTLGPAVAYVDDAGELWMSNGGLPRQITPHFDFNKEVWRWDKARLMNNPAKQRLELHYQEESKPFTGAVLVSTAFFPISYHPEHVLSPEVFNVMGPVEYGPDAAVSNVFVGMASSSTGVYGLDRKLDIQQVGGAPAEGLVDGVDARMVSHVINPVGLGKDWMIYSLRITHRFDLTPGSLTLRAYDHGDHTYSSHDMDINVDTDPTVQHHNAQFSSEGVQVDVEGPTRGALDAIEVDVDPGVGPLSD